MSDLISAADLASFREKGFFITKPMFSAAELKGVRDEFDRLWAEAVADAEKSGDQKLISFTKNRPFVGQAHTRSPLLVDFVKSPIYLEACAKLIGADADLYYNQAVLKVPEIGKRFGWHQDTGYLVTDPLEYVTAWTAIGPATLENGCIWVLPGSHKRGPLTHVRNEAENSLDVPVDDESGAIPVEVEAGQVVIFNALLLHKSGPNTSKSVRYAYVPQYHVPKVKEKATGQLTGDQFHVLRDGKRVS
jgi:ectoine hydroxylase-related dioxygenase (phytanoyl-CoA dioxygenase family)